MDEKKEVNKCKTCQHFRVCKWMRKVTGEEEKCKESPSLYQPHRG